MKSVIKILMFAILFSGFSLYAQDESDGQTETQEAVEEIEEANEDASDVEEVIADVAEVEEGATAAEVVTVETSISMEEIRNAIRLLQESQTLLNALLTTTDEIPGVDEVSVAVQAVNEGLEDVETAAEDALAPVESSVSLFSKIIGFGKTSLEVILGFKIIFEAGELVVEGYNRWAHGGEDAVSGSSTGTVNYKCIGKKLKGFSNAHKPLVSACVNALNQVKAPVKDLKNVFPEFNTYGKKLAKDLKPLSEFAKKTEASLKKMNKDFKKTLDAKIDFKFTISVFSLRHDFHIRLISVREGLKGVDHIISELESKMDPTIGKAARGYGLDKIAKEIEKLAMEALNDAINDLINGLKKIKQPKIENLVKTLTKVEKDYKKSAKALNKIIHVGTPEYDKGFYRKVHDKKFNYFLDACSQ